MLGPASTQESSLPAPSAEKGQDAGTDTTCLHKGWLLEALSRRKVLLIHPDCFNWLIKQLTLNKTTFAAGALGNKMTITTTCLLLTTAFNIIIT